MHASRALDAERCSRRFRYSPEREFPGCPQLDTSASPTRDVGDRWCLHYKTFARVCMFMSRPLVLVWTNPDCHPTDSTCRGRRSMSVCGRWSSCLVQHVLVQFSETQHNRGATAVLKGIAWHSGSQHALGHAHCSVERLLDRCRYRMWPEDDVSTMAIGSLHVTFQSAERRARGDFSLLTINIALATRSVHVFWGSLVTMAATGWKRMVKTLSRQKGGVGNSPWPNLTQSHAQKVVRWEFSKWQVYQFQILKKARHWRQPMMTRQKYWVTRQLFCCTVLCPNLFLWAKPRSTLPPSREPPGIRLSFDLWTRSTEAPATSTKI